MTPAQRSLRARIGAYAMLAKHDPRKANEASRRVFKQRFFDATDPSLPDAERHRQAEMKYREHFARMAYLRHRGAR